jgi:hypothetical protein
MDFSMIVSPSDLSNSPVMVKAAMCRLFYNAPGFRNVKAATARQWPPHSLWPAQRATVGICP